MACNDEVIREYAPYFEAGGPRCNDGYAFALECEPGAQCEEEHTQSTDGRCIVVESGEYHPFFEAGGMPCNDGYAFALACMSGDTCEEKHTQNTTGLCIKPE